MKVSSSRIIKLIALGVASIALFLLIVGLPQLDMDPGVPFQQLWLFLMDQFSVERVTTPYATELPGGGLLLRIYRTIFFIALVAFPIVIILIFVDPELRKRFLRAMLRTLILAGLLFAIFRNQSEPEEGVTIEPLGSVGPPGEEFLGDTFTPDTLAPEHISPWIGRGLSLGLGLLTAAILVAIIVRIRRNRREPESDLDNIAQQARVALQEIEAGGDLRDIVLQCYVQMTRTVREQRGIRRDQAVTAREFTEYLIKAQLPDYPVNRLTRLFEKARYGGKTTTHEDEEEAIASLSAIVRACEELT